MKTKKSKTRHGTDGKRPNKVKELLSSGRQHRCFCALVFFSMFQKRTQQKPAALDNLAETLPTCSYWRRTRSSTKHKSVAPNV